MIFRPARPEEAAALAPLLAAASPTLMAQVLTLGGHSPEDYLSWALTLPGGIFGHSRLTVGERDGRAVMTLTSYPGSQAGKLGGQTLHKLSRFYGFKVATLLWRSLPLARIFESPPADSLFLANICVVPELRSQGLLHQALEDQLTVAGHLGLGALALDVSDDNPRAEAAYLRHGFVQTSCTQGISSFPGNKRLVRRI